MEWLLAILVFVGVWALVASAQKNAKRQREDDAEGMTDAEWADLEKRVAYSRDKQERRLRLWRVSPDQGCDWVGHVRQAFNDEQPEAAMALFREAVAKRDWSNWGLATLCERVRIELGRVGAGQRLIPFGVVERLCRYRHYCEMLTEEMAYPEPHAELHKNRVRSAETWIAQLSEPEDIEKRAKFLCRKAGKPEMAGEVAASMKKHLEAFTDPWAYLEQAGEL